MTDAEIIVSHYQIAPLVRAHRKGETSGPFSPDLNLTQSTAEITSAGIIYNGDVLTWTDAGDLAETDNACFLLRRENGRLKPEKVFIFSAETRRQVSLYPTPRAPALLVAGLPMHRIKGVDPLEDTRLKVSAAQPNGVVLDTSMGLGYTAIGAARRAEQVITLEVDPAVEAVARFNPWSRDLFNNPRIERRIIDSVDAVQAFPENAFSRILHDPPTVALAGDLYSGSYYRDLFRVLRRGGRLFHYIGDLNSPSGARTVRGVIERLQAAGFKNVTKRPEAFAVIAFK